MGFIINNHLFTDPNDLTPYKINKKTINNLKNKQFKIGLIFTKKKENLF